MPGYATGLFGVNLIDPKPLSVNRVRGHVLNAMKQSALEARSYLEDIVATWEHPVEFSKPIIRYSGGDAYVSISTNDDIFRYLDEGTLIRWAIMSRDFIPKTVPNGPFRSGRGRGGAVVAGERYMRQHNMMPQRGIQARNWMIRLNTIIGYDIAVRTDRAIAAGLGTQP